MRHLPVIAVLSCVCAASAISLPLHAPNDVLASTMEPNDLPGSPEDTDENEWDGERDWVNNESEGGLSEELHPERAMLEAGMDDVAMDDLAMNALDMDETAWNLKKLEAGDMLELIKETYKAVENLTEGAGEELESRHLWLKKMVLASKFVRTAMEILQVDGAGDDPDYPMEGPSYGRHNKGREDEDDDEDERFPGADGGGKWRRGRGKNEYRRGGWNEHQKDRADRWVLEERMIVRGKGGRPDNRGKEKGGRKGWNKQHIRDDDLKRQPGGWNKQHNQDDDTEKHRGGMGGPRGGKGGQEGKDRGGGRGRGNDSRNGRDDRHGDRWGRKGKDGRDGGKGRGKDGRDDRRGGKGKEKGARTDRDGSKPKGKNGRGDRNKDRARGQGGRPRWGSGGL